MKKEKETEFVFQVCGTVVHLPQLNNTKHSSNPAPHTAVCFNEATPLCSVRKSERLSSIFFLFSQLHL